MTVFLVAVAITNLRYTTENSQVSKFSYGLSACVNKIFQK